MPSGSGEIVSEIVIAIVPSNCVLLSNAGMGLGENEEEGEVEDMLENEVVLEELLE